MKARKQNENDSCVYYHIFCCGRNPRIWTLLLLPNVQGFLVREFAIGMGPKLFAHQGKDGTTYTIRMLPLGGYVQMAGWGEDETELTPGMPISLVQDKDGKVIKINTSKKVQLPHAIPMEVVDFDLEEKLTIAGYINGNEQEKSRLCGRS